jgi:hypothetical protein
MKHSKIIITQNKRSWLRPWRTTPTMYWCFYHINDDGCLTYAHITPYKEEQQ